METAAYGFYISNDDKLAEIWLKRNDGTAEKKFCSKEFKTDKIKLMLSERAKKLGDIFDTLYDRTIDYGAHSNEKGFSLSSKMDERKTETEFLQFYLQGDGIAMDLSLKSAAQIGVWCLSIFQLVYPEKFQLLGIRDQLTEFRKEL